MIPTSQSHHKPKSFWSCCNNFYNLARANKLGHHIYYSYQDHIYFYQMRSNGYGSIPMKIAFLGGWTSINLSYFDVNYRGTLGFDTLPNDILSYEHPPVTSLQTRWGADPNEVNGRAQVAVLPQDLGHLLLVPQGVAVARHAMNRKQFSNRFYGGLMGSNGIFDHGI